MQRMPRQKLNAHLEFIRSLPCVICGNNIETQAAHIRMSDARVVKVNAGVGAKADDYWTLPMCNRHHEAQHAVGNESKFWRGIGIDPILYALRLWSVTGNHELGCQVVEAANVNASARGIANILMAG